MEYKTEEKIFNKFLNDEWHILFDFGEDDFLRFLQLQTLRKMDGFSSIKEEYKNIDIKKLLTIGYKTIHNKTKEEIIEIMENNRYYFDSDEVEVRGELLEYAYKWLRRFDNDELRDIIFNHPIREVQDEYYTDEAVNQENFCTVQYEHKLLDTVKKEIQEQNPCNQYKKHLKELKTYQHI